MRPLPRGILALAMLLSFLAAPAGAPAGAASADVTSFQGLGAWVDLYDPHLLAAPGRTVASLAGRGVRTIYLETSNYQMPHALMNRASLGQYVDAAHARGMRIVAWYVPSFLDLREDLRRSMAAVRFRSPGGEAFDAFGLDIEATRVADWGERSRRAVELSKQIRRAVGPEYPLAAIVLPPPLLDDSPSYWPGFPFKGLAPHYDAFLPMGYWTYRYGGLGGAYDFTVRTIEGLRARTGRPSLPIHPIGGIADAVDADEVRGFARAVREYGAIGASLYDVGTSDDLDWAGLREVAATPVQRPPSPLVLGKHFGEFGNLPSGDATHPRDVVFRVGRRSGPWELDYEAFGLDAAEISVRVNWQRVAVLRPSLPGWSARRTLLLPAGMLAHDRNTIMFTAREPGATWGVRGVSLIAGALPMSDRRFHGNIPDLETSRADRVTYRVPAGGGVLSFAVQGFDIGPGEVEVRLDSISLGYLLPTVPGGLGPAQSFLIPPGLAGPGPHRLTFDAVSFPPERTVWGMRLVDARALSVVPGH